MSTTGIPSSLGNAKGVRVGSNAKQFDFEIGLDEGIKGFASAMKDESEKDTPVSSSVMSIEYSIGAWSSGSSTWTANFCGDWGGDSEGRYSFKFRE